MGLRTTRVLIELLSLAFVAACGDAADSAASAGAPLAGSGGSTGGSSSSLGPAGGGGGSASGQQTGPASGRGGGSDQPGPGNLGSAGEGGAGRTSPAAGGSAAGGSAAQGGGTSGSGGMGSAAGGCSRALLQGSVDAYFAALAARDASTLPLADAVKFTENGETLAIGEAGLWTTAGALRHSHSALDTEACTSVTQAVVADGNTAIPFALRLKLEDQQITEIESIAVRPGDYLLASNTEALIASASTVGWEQTVPAEQRDSRAAIAAWMEKYFRMFPRGVCSTSDDCERIENGGGSFGCSAGASCDPAAPGPGDEALTPRLVLVDVETGLGAGFTMFQGNTDMHLFKMYGGQVYGVSAILAEAASSGWD